MSRSEHRKWEAAAAVLALALFAIAGAWHHHPVSAIDDFSLESSGHGVSAGECQVCKLSTAGAVLPSNYGAPHRLEAVHGRTAPEGFLPSRKGLDAGRPTRAPPADHLV